MARLREDNNYARGYKAALDDVHNFILLAESGQLDDAESIAAKDDFFFNWLAIMLGYRQVV